MANEPSAPRPGERGLALVAVLWGVAILSLIAAAMLATGYLSVRLSRNAFSRTEAETAADNGVARAILALLDGRKGAHWPADGTSQRVAVAGVAMTIAIQDERGRIDLNAASPDLIRSLLESQGVESDRADRLTDRIVAWRTPPGHGLSEDDAAPDYRDAGYAIVPRRGPFQSVDELRLVLGMTGALYDRLEPLLTVYSRQPAVDEAVAPRAVLLALPGMDAEKVDAILAARAKSGEPSPPADAPPLAGHSFAITVDVTKGSAHVVRKATVELTGDAARPYLVRQWH